MLVNIKYDEINLRILLIKVNLKSGNKYFIRKTKFLCLKIFPSSLVIKNHKVIHN